MKIYPVFIEKKLEYPLYKKNIYDTFILIVTRYNEISSGSVQIRKVCIVRNL